MRARSSDVVSATSSLSARDGADVRWLLLSVAFVWVATAVLVVFPYYREIGGQYLDRLGLPHWLMFGTCAFELLLGLRVAFGRPTTVLLALQVGMVATFTVILAVDEPLLLAHPYGVLTKNLPLVGALGVASYAWHRGFDARATTALRVAMALPWLTEGLFPKLLFQQASELEVVRASGLVPMDPGAFLRILGVAQILSAVAALALRGTPRRALLIAQAASLLVLPVLVAWHDPHLWIHPFAPLLKNVPILVGTIILVRRP